MALSNMRLMMREIKKDKGQFIANFKNLKFCTQEDAAKIREEFKQATREEDSAFDHKAIAQSQAQALKEEEDSSFDRKLAQYLKDKDFASGFELAIARSLAQDSQQRFNNMDNSINITTIGDEAIGFSNEF